MRLGRRPWLIWLAIVALLVQVAVPDLAMGTPAFAGRAMGVPAFAGGRTIPGQDICHAEVPGTRGPIPDRDQGWAHPCPFCLAAACHALGSVAGPRVPPRTAMIVVARPVADTGIQPGRPFLICLSPRAPPALLPA